MKSWRASKGEYVDEYCVENNGVKIYFDKIVVSSDKWTLYIDGDVVTEVQRDQNILVDPENLLSEVMVKK